jgi:hypothetical protein
VGWGATVGLGLGLGASVGAAVAVLTVAGVGDLGTVVDVAAGVGVRGTGVTVAGAARARAGNCKPTTPETATRRKKERRGSMGNSVQRVAGKPANRV